MNEKTALSLNQEQWLRQEVLTALDNGRWQDHKKLVTRVRKRWGWATVSEVDHAIDTLWDDDMIKRREQDRKAPAGSLDSRISVLQWKTLKPS